MAGLARANIIGRLGADAVTRHTRNGNPICNFDVAVNRKKGQGREETIWINVSAWGNLGLRCCEHLKKGMTVYVWGDIHESEFIDKEGIKRTSWQIQAQAVEWNFERAVA